MIMSSIFRRLLPQSSNGSRRKIFSAAAVVNRELVSPSSSPWMMLPPSFTEEETIYKLYSLMKGGKVVSVNYRGKQETDTMRSAALVGSSHGWLSLIDPLTRDLFLFNPLSGRRVDLPPYAGRPFRQEEIVRGPWKLTISCSPYRDDCRALMILGTRDRVALCRPGRSNEWSPLGRWYDDSLSAESFNEFRLYSDLTYSAAQKKLFAFVDSGMAMRQELEGWDISDPVRPRTVQLDRFAAVGREWKSRMSLSIVAGDDGEVFVVRRYYVDGETSNVKVYRVKDGDMELCWSLDDMVMFVGINDGVAVKASEFPDLKPNSIYFSDGRDVRRGDSQYIGVFDYQNKTCSPVYYPSLDRQFQKPIPHPWFLPTIDN